MKVENQVHTLVNTEKFRIIRASNTQMWRRSDNGKAGMGEVGCGGVRWHSCLANRAVDFQQDYNRGTFLKLEEKVG